MMSFNHSTALAFGFSISVSNGDASRGAITGQMPAKPQFYMVFLGY
jgi:hypothetical protein